MKIENHSLVSVNHVASPFFNERPNPDDISLLVIHNISLPAGCFGLPYIDDLFSGTLDCSADPSFEDLRGVEVSAHCLIKRDGSITQYVPFDKRAWHAGVSSFDGRSGCNDFSIGIELEGTDDIAYSDAQYESLIVVANCLIKHYPKILKQRITGHSDIAPGRKTDPGASFNWQRFRQGLDSE